MVVYLCDKEFDKTDKVLLKIRDHCHYAGKYRDVAHLGRDLRYKDNSYIRAIALKLQLKDYNILCTDENTEKWNLYLFFLKKGICKRK